MVLIENQEYLCEEEKRLKADRERTAYWKRWGPYTAERQWATGQFSSPCLLRSKLTHSQFARTTRKFPRRHGRHALLTNFLQPRRRCMESYVFLDH